MTENAALQKLSCLVDGNKSNLNIHTCSDLYIYFDPPWFNNCPGAQNSLANLYIMNSLWKDALISHTPNAIFIFCGRVPLDDITFNDVFNNHLSQFNNIDRTLFNKATEIVDQLKNYLKDLKIQISTRHFCPLQPSPARLLLAGGTTAPSRSFTSDSRSASPVPRVSRSRAAAPSPAGRTRPGAPSALRVKVGEKILNIHFGKLLHVRCWFHFYFKWILKAQI